MRPLAVRCPGSWPAVAALALLLVLPGCETLQVNTAPTVPALVKIEIAASDPNRFVELAAAPMPIPYPDSPSLVVTVTAPFPGDLAVAIDGAELTDNTSTPFRAPILEEQGIPYFSILKIDEKAASPVWRVKISPKAVQQCALEAFTIDVTHSVANIRSAPLRISFAPSRQLTLIGTTGRIVALEAPACGSIAEFGLERRSGAGAFTNIATLPKTGGRYRDFGLSPRTPFEYRLSLSRRLPNGSGNIVGSTAPVAAVTSQLLSGRLDIAAVRDTQDPFTYRFTTFDPLIRSSPSLAIDATLTRVQNDGPGLISVSFIDKNGVRLSQIQITAMSSMTAPFEGLRLAGTWYPIRSMGSAALQPASWPMTIFWEEP